jgi:hypothetical protein
MPGPMPGHPGVSNPFGIEGYPLVARVLGGVVVLLSVCVLASAVSLVLRYRRSRGEERQQIKWIAFAASFVGLVYLIAMVSPFIGVPERLLSVVGLSFVGVPVAIGFAVLKYRLYDNRRGHQPYPRLRSSHRVVGACVLRGRGDDAGHLPSTHRPTRATADRHSRLHLSDSCAVQPLEAPHPVLHR